MILQDRILQRWFKNPLRKQKETKIIKDEKTDNAFQFNIPGHHLSLCETSLNSFLPFFVSLFFPSTICEAICFQIDPPVQKFQPYFLPVFQILFNPFSFYLYLFATMVKNLLPCRLVFLYVENDNVSSCSPSSFSYR